MMVRCIIRRIGLLFIILFGISIITFLLVYCAPGDPAESIAFSRYGAEELTKEAIERIRYEEGLDAPIFTQYLKWLSHVIQGDLGKSLRTRDQVIEVIFNRLPATMLLSLSSIVITIIISIPIGMFSAIKAYTKIDNFFMVLTLLGISIPHFLLALILIIVFAVNLHILPVCGYGNIRYLILPSMTLSIGMFAITARITRASMLDVLSQDYIITARAKGLKEFFIMYRHAFKNAIIPVITIVGLQFGTLLSGSVIIEKIFAWPGLGTLMVDSVFTRDIPIIQGCVLFYAIFFILTNLVVDILYIIMDPRIRYEG